jgi:valyl-tRNA synthetase
MIFTGLELMGEIPFSHVIIHTTVLAPDGRRMSKSLGTGMDPLELVDEHGADATRYGLLKISSSQDVRFSITAVEEGRKLANKLWNVSRLILANVGEAHPEARPKSLEEEWMIARLDSAHATITERFDEFDFAGVARRLYHLTFDEFCDWYAEAIKPRLYEGDADAQSTALALLERLLKYLHPVMPHVTEEIWSHLPHRTERLIVSGWPEWDERYADREPDFEQIRTAAEIFRRSGVMPALTEDQRRIFEAVVRPGRVKADSDAPAEIERLTKEIARAEGMLANERFTSKAPPDVVEAEREKLARYRRELDAISD